MNKLRILLADDHEVVRHGMKVILQARSDWEVCGEARDGMQAVAMTAQLGPDIVVMDLCMPNLNGLEATREIIWKDPQRKVLVVTLTDNDQVIRAALEAGARGFVLKSDAARDLVSAIESPQQDSTFFTPRMRGMVLDSGTQPQVKLRRLTSRERQIVQLLAEGKSSKDVAIILDLSVKTVETHRANILRKLKLHSVVELVLYALQNNIVMLHQCDSDVGATSVHHGLGGRGGDSEQRSTAP